MDKYAIEQLEPKTVWKNFKSLCQIPHPSKKEAKITAFMKQFGESLHLETIVDSVGNVFIRKPATPGFEDRKGVILQAHLDMVPQKNSGIEHDFEKDPIIAYVDNGWVKAENTTLGADDGIGVATIMSVLESKTMEHGPIEAFFSVDEEDGMTGAINLSTDALKGSILLNLDSEEEGIFTIGCAGGINTLIELPYSNEPTPKNNFALNIKVTGLRGGHSGADIDLQRGNANKILNRILWQSEKLCDLRLSAIDGGSVHNAIPREASALVAIPTTKKDAYFALLEKETQSIKTELGSADPECKIETIEAPLPDTVMAKVSQTALLNAIYGCPHGVLAMSKSIKGLVETSTNLAKIKSENGIVSILTSQRSSIESSKYEISNMIRSIFELAGAKVNASNGYPGWAPNPESEIVTLSTSVYEKIFHQTPKVAAVHAGLECGLIGAKYPKMDMVSIGPNLKFAHSPDEKIEIQSVEKFWVFLIELLRQIPKQ
jgi:dipeptidase D